MDSAPIPHAAENGSDTGPTMVRQRLWRRIAVAVTSVIAGFVFIIAAAAFAWVGTTPKMEAMLPADVPAATETSLTWWWSAGAPLRRIPQVQQALQQIEAQEHISIQQDVLPWAGQGGAALLHYDQQSPKLAFFVQVRDWMAFARFARRLQSHTPVSVLGAPNSHRTRTGTYDGIAFQSDSTKDKQGRPVLIESAMVHGWFVVGVGSGSLEQILDTYTGKVPTLAANAAWQSAQAQLPKTSVGWTAVNTGTLIAQVPQAAQKVASDKNHFLGVAVFSDLGQGLRWDAVTVPTAPAARQQLQQMASAQTVTLTPAALQSVPNDAVATIMTSNAAAGAKQVLDWFGSLLATYGGADTAKSLKTDAAKLASLNGLSEASIVVSPDGKTIGADGFADAASPNAAQSVQSTLLTWGAKPLDKALVNPKPAPTNSLQDLELVTAVQGNRLLLSTAPALMPSSVPAGASYISFPAEASGASWLAAGNFKFLTPLRQWADDPKNAQAQAYHGDELIGDFGLDNAQWTTWARIDPAGRWQKQTTIINQWNWRAAMDKTVSTGIRLEHPSAHPVPGAVL